MSIAFHDFPPLFSRETICLRVTALIRSHALPLIFHSPLPPSALGFLVVCYSHTSLPGDPIPGWDGRFCDGPPGGLMIASPAYPLFLQEPRQRKLLVVFHLGLFPFLSVCQSEIWFLSNSSVFLLEEKSPAAYFPVEDDSHNIRSNNIRADRGAVVSPFHSSRTQIHSNYLRPQLFWGFWGPVLGEVKFPWSQKTRRCNWMESFV